MKNIILLLFTFFTHLLWGIEINQTLTSHSIEKDYYIYTDTCRSTQIETIINLSISDWQKATKKCFVEVNDDYAYWIKIPIMNSNKVEKQLVLDISFSDINILHFYLFKNQQFADSTITGDYYPISSRMLKTNDFSFPFSISQNDTLNTIYLRVYNHTETFILPLAIYDKQEYLSQKSKSNFYWGIYFCSAFFFILLATVSWIFVQTKTYLYYIFYLFSLFLFLMAQKGFTFFLLYPEYPFIQNIVNPVSVGAFTFFALLFGREFIELKLYHPVLYRINIIFTYITGIFILTMFFVMNLSQTIINLIQTLYLTILFIDGILLILSGLISSFKQRKSNTYLYFIAYTCVTGGFGIFYLMFFKIIPSTSLIRNIIYINSMVEMFIFSSYLTIQINIVRSRRLTNLKQLKEEQKLTVLSLFLGEEKERKRLSLDLHDGLGVLFSTMKNRIALYNKDSEKYVHEHKKASKLIKQTSEELHAICDSIFPAMLNHKDIIPLLRDVVSALNNKNINYTLQAPEKLIIKNKNKRINLFRIIQEITNNIDKHSLAKNASITLRQNGPHIVLMIKDNGIGFRFHDNKSEGIGLRNIQSRIDFLGGKLKFNNKNGATFNIRFSNE